MAQFILQRQQICFKVFVFYYFTSFFCGLSADADLYSVCCQCDKTHRSFVAFAWSFFGPSSKRLGLETIMRILLSAHLIIVLQVLAVTYLVRCRRASFVARRSSRRCQSTMSSELVATTSRMSGARTTVDC